MEQNGPTPTTTDDVLLATKSWTAYLGVAFMAFLLLLLITPLVWSSSTGAGIVVLLASSLFLAYKFAVLKSYQLYMDANGIWCFSGVLPWNKGVRGVKWRDLDEDIYFQGMASWAFKSYTIRIGHRFTKSSEVVLAHMTRGDQAVMQINQQHQELVRANALQ
jgi:hypothetical protein